ncbi:MAG: thiamine pyrophosphate-dependent enzyme, partial [Planctomycetota bacterium]
AYGNGGQAIKPQAVIEELARVAPHDAIIATEVGQHQMWTALFYTFRHPRTLLTSGGLGTMGYGFPAALGAQVGCPDRLVLDIAGDGSFQMNMQELTTAAAYDLPVKVIILNNGSLGMVRQWQQLFYDRRYSQTMLARNPDFVRLAESCGAAGFRVEARGDLRTALEQTLATDGPALLDVAIEPEENVFPMVPAGQAINRMIGGMA